MVGKTSILQRYLEKTLPDVHNPTIGLEFATTTVIR